MKRFSLMWGVVIGLLTLTQSGYAQSVPYINAAVADTEFHRITAHDMDILRTKKILFFSRSFGLNMVSGLSELAAQDTMYKFLNSYVRYDIFSSGGDLSVIPEDAFKKYNFIHVMCTASPYTTRLSEFDKLLRTFPHYFADDAMVGMMDFHSSDSATFGPYSATMDSLHVDFPSIKFIYVTAGLEGPSQVGLNDASAKFSTMVRAKYKGYVPLYDWGFLLNNDSACGNHYCPQYSTDAADVHADAPFAEQRVAKAFLLMLYKLFCENQPTCSNTNPPSVPTGLTGQGKSLTLIRLSWQPSTQTPCGVDYYNVRRDGVDIGVSYGLSYSDHDLTENTPYSYQVAAVSRGNVTSNYCTAVPVNTLNDNIPPAILSVPNTIVGTQVTVIYSEYVDSLTALNPAHYAVSNNVTIQSARYFGADSIVVLTTTQLPGNVLCTLTVNGVTDRSVNHNTIAANTKKTFKFNSMSLTGNVLAYLNFNGNTLDGSGNNLNGVWTGTASYGTGIAGQCVTLDGTSGGPYVSIPDNALLNDMAQLSVGLWAKKHSTASGGVLCYKHLEYSMNINGAYLTGLIYNSTGSQVGFNATVPQVNDTNWHHYCFVYDGATVKSFVDGAHGAVSAQTGSIASDNGLGFYIGKDPWGNAFNGDIDEVRMYNWAVDSASVKRMMMLGVGNADSLAVRALLDANGLYNKAVGGDAGGGVAVFDSSRRIVELYIQEGGITQITSDIGQLTELKLLNCYGDRKQSYPLLASVSPAIGKCTKLTQLLLNQNNLNVLPVEITSLKNLTVCSIGDNLLCSLPDTIKQWADTYDPDWQTTQNCSTSIRPDRKAPFFIHQTAKKITIVRGTIIGLLDAEIYTLEGRLMYSIQSCTKNELTLSTDAIRSGKYCIRVANGKTSYVRSVVIIK